MSSTDRVANITIMAKFLFLIAATAILGSAAGQLAAADAVVPPPPGLTWFDPDKAAGTTEEADTKQVKDYLANIVSLRADFVQIAPDHTVSAGKLVLERPGRIRFDYDAPSPLLIVGDGRVINLIDYELRQVTKWPIMRTPLRPLVSQDIVYGKDVQITDIARDASGIGVSMVDPSNAREGSLHMVFAREPFTLQRWEVTDSQGQITIVALENVETNMAIDRTVFTFKDPRPRRRKIPGRR